MANSNLWYYDYLVGLAYRNIDKPEHYIHWHNQLCKVWRYL